MNPKEQNWWDTKYFRRVPFSGNQNVVLRKLGNGKIAEIRINERCVFEGGIEDFEMLNFIIRQMLGTSSV